MDFSDWLEEATYRKHVDSAGNVTRKKDRKSRQRRATQTTGRSKSDRKRSARRAAKTRKKNPGRQKKALRQRRKTLRKRKARLGSKA